MSSVSGPMAYPTRQLMHPMSRMAHGVFSLRADGVANVAYAVSTDQARGVSMLAAGTSSVRQQASGQSSSTAVRVPVPGSRVANDAARARSSHTRHHATTSSQSAESHSTVHPLTVSAAATSFMSMSLSGDSADDEGPPPGWKCPTQSDVDDVFEQFFGTKSDDRPERAATDASARTGRAVPAATVTTTGLRGAATMRQAGRPHTKMRDSTLSVREHL